jgi:hypothetical protein
MTGTHEHRDMTLKAALAVGLGMTLLVASAFAATLVVFHYFVPRHMATPNLAAQVQSFPEPRLQIAPGEDLGMMNEANRQKLDNYGWVDRSSGVARIPIERAMDIVVDQGWQEHAHDGR